MSDSTPTLERFRERVLLSSNIRGGALNHLSDEETRAVIRAALDASGNDERPTAAMLAAGLDAWERTAGTREDMLRNAFVAMLKYRAALTSSKTGDER